MATLKLKTTQPKTDFSETGRPRDADAAKSPRPPVRGVGSGVRARPTLAQAQAQREERERQYQEQLRQRFGSRPAPESTRRPRPEQPPAARTERAPRQDPARPSRPPERTADSGRASSGRTTNSAFGARPPRGNAGPDRQAAREPARQERQYPARAETSNAPGTLRLSKYMSELGIASRREADEWIDKGWVRVDGRVVSELGSRVVPGQHVTIDAKARFVQAQKVTVLINKPVGYVSGQAEDGYEPAYVLVKPDKQWTEDHSGIRFLPQHLRSLVPAGRLDIDSVGLLVLTQDGRVAKQLIGENSEIEKEYLVRVASAEGGGLSDQGLALLRHGLELDGQALLEAQVEWVNEDQLRFVLREGKKRQIRRMCEAVGLQVLGLKRVRIGKLMLGDLPTGQWRYLRLDEGFI